MKKSNRKNKCIFFSVIFTILIGIAYLQSENVSDLIKNANAKQGLVSMEDRELFDRQRNLVAFSPDGGVLAHALEGNQVTLQDVVTGQTRWSWVDTANDTVTALAFSVTGKTVASVGKNAINFWNVDSGQEKGSISLANKSSAIAQLVFSPNGKRIAGRSFNNDIFLWSVDGGHSKSAQLAQGVAVHELMFSPDGKTLAGATVGKNSKIELWNAATGKSIAELPAKMLVSDIAFSPDNKMLASAGLDGQIKLWDLVSGAIKQTIETHEELAHVVFSPENSLLASGSRGNDPKVQVWNYQNGDLLFSRQTEGGEAVADLFFNAVGNLLASVGKDNRISLFNLPDGDIQHLLIGHTDKINRAAFNATQSSLAAVGKDGQLLVWDLVSGFVQQGFQLPNFASANLTSPSTPTSASSSVAPKLSDTSKLPAVAKNSATADAGNNISGSDKAKKFKKRSAQRWKGIKALAVSNDGTEMGAGSVDGTIQIFKKSGKARWKISGHHGKAISALAFKGKGKQWVSVGRDTEIKVWDDATGNHVKTYFGLEHPPRTVAVSPDGKFIATAGEETRVFIYDAAAGKLKNIFSGHVDFVNNLAFSPDSKLLASAGAEGNILLWDVSTGKQLKKFRGHSDEVNAVAFSPDGSMLASAGVDSSVILWNIGTGYQIRTLSGHQGSVRSVAFSPNGKKLVSAGDDTRMLVWNPVTGQLKKQLAGPTVINALAFDPNGNLHVANESSEIAEINTDTGVQVESIAMPPAVESQANVLTAPNDEMVVSSVDAALIDKTPAKSSQITFGTIVNNLLDWVIPSANAALPDPNEGPGGPILVITSGTPTFGKFYAEILRTEGLNEFAMADIATVNASTLNSYDVVILAEMPLDTAQTQMFENWVTAGGNLIAMRPDKDLASLLGLTDANSTLDNGYLLVNTAASPGNGIVGQTMQFHGTADRYALSGATAVATLYNNANTLTTNPAVTLRNIGSAGGQAAAFTFDLAKSIVYTRQGNPAWANQERDGFLPIRSDDKFYGNATGDPQVDWIDFNKIAIPQADEQQRLLANLILEMNRDKKPLPRFWYFPSNKKAVIVMTGDDHGAGFFGGDGTGTTLRFEQFKNRSPVNCSVDNWECVRGTSYLFPETTAMTEAQAIAYNAQGFEVGLHVNTNCSDYNATTLEDIYTQQIAGFVAKFPNATFPLTQRHHCIVWSDWATAAKVQLNHGIRLDTTYYFWPPSWVLNRPGFFSGSGMPMRFADLDGAMIDVYNASSHMTDESGQSYPFTVDTLLDRALGAEGYYGAFTLNAHTDLPEIVESNTTLDSAISRGVPIVSAKQMLAWLDGRNSSSFGSLAWNGNDLSFTVNAASGANNLRGLLPSTISSGVLLNIVHTPTGGNPTPVSFTLDTIKGITYAIFPASAGTYTATYGADTTAPTVTAKTPADGATGISQGVSITATFSEAMDPVSISNSSVELRDSANGLVAAIVSYNPSNRTLTLKPSITLASLAAYTATIRGGATDPRVKDLAGNALTANVTWSFTTETQPCVEATCSSWTNTAVPTIASVNDPASVELGVKFRTDIPGFVTGIRFYKGDTNTGTHIGNLWTASGTRLATATFTGETASGWQQVSFSAPVPIQAGVTYIASYFAPNGHYAETNSPEFSAQGVDNGPIHLLRDGVDGGNGVYNYNSSSVFPANTFNSSNYWVDLVFVSSLGPDTTPPTVTEQSPANGATSISTNVAMTVTFNEAMDANSITNTSIELRGPAPSNTLIPSAVSYNLSTQTATLVPNSALSGLSTYSVTVKGGTADPRVKDAAGNAMVADHSWSFTTAEAGAAGCGGLTNTIWPASATPAVPADTDGQEIELGVKFRSNVNGYVCGIRFYKGNLNTGIHTGTLWRTSDGQALATATFTNESTSGWQQVNFSAPVAINANDIYVASYHSSQYFALTSGDLLATGVSNGPLSAPATGEVGGNGVYRVGPSGLPTSTFGGNNYWVDVVFTADIGPDTTPPSVISTVPAANVSGINPVDPITVVFNENMDSASITGSTLELRNTASNTLIPTAVSYNASTRTATLAPNSALIGSTAYSVTVKGGATDPRVKDAAGNAMVADHVWSFTTAEAGATGCSGITNTIWPGTTTPTVPADTDGQEIELGVKFRANVNGYVCGIRFYKGSLNTGPHTGTLWRSSDGQLLATASFTNESASGWQQVNFSAPVAINANDIYVASYHSSQYFALTAGGFLSAGVNNGPLYVPATGEVGGNGVYRVGPSGLPTSTFGGNNYWVDVVFTTDIGPDLSPPTVNSTQPASNATGVVPANPVTVTFSEPMDASTVTDTTVELRNQANVKVPASVSYNASNNTASLLPNAALAESSVYTAKVIGGANGVKDPAGNSLAVDFTWQFTTGVDPCSTGGNPIVCENSKLGNPASEWDINGIGDSSIQGFATDISVNRGQTVRFKIDTVSTNYRLDIYRMGYYGGLGARKVATVEPAAFPVQPACHDHLETGLIDCGNWTESASWNIPANATSGIYFAKAIREDAANTGASHIVFIVRDDASTSDILFQTADTTWQAYNNYGGNSLYAGSPAGRAYKVSYNRPFNTRIVDNGQDWVFNAEYPMVRWLEANGYNVSYFTGVDSDRYGNLIRNHKLFMSNAHDEYWSAQQRVNVEAARDAGVNPVNLAFFSGNEVFWKTRWENNIVNSNGGFGVESHRTLVCYKETHAGAKIDPLPNVWTGTWRDPRFSPPADGGKPENALMGPIFTVNDGATTSITIPQEDGQMRFWRNTSVANLAVGASETLPFGTLGYEWDEDLDNGFRPAGLVRLSTTIVPGAPVLTDYGSNFGSGLANHALTLYKAESGAIVFGAGTVQWAWGLDNNHDRAGTPVSPAMRQATINLFADMGIQPATLQAGLLTAQASTDTAAPTSVITQPANGASASVGSLMIISGTASDIGGKVGGVEVSVDGGSTWHPANGRINWTYSWTTPATNGLFNIKSRAVDDSLNMEVPGAGVMVSVGTGTDTTPPTTPSGLNAVQASGTESNLTWTAASDAGGISGYRVERCQGVGCTSFVEIATPTASPFANTGLTEGVTYRYRVRAVDNSGNLGAYSNIATIVLDVTAPGLPANLNLTATSGTQVSLTWTASTDNVGVTGYRLERCQGVGCSGFTEVATPAAANFADTGLTSGATYLYRVRATDAAGNLSAYSAVASATTPAPDAIAPSVPGSLAGSSTSGTQVSLTWTASTDNVGVTGYRLERCQGVGCSGFTEVATPAAANFADTGLTAGATYLYRVRATDAAGNLSAYSAVASATTPAPDAIAPSVPGSLAGSATSGTQVSLTWTASTDNVGVTGYRLERCQGIGCADFTEIATPSVTNFADTGLTAGTTYQYRVRATDAASNLSSSSSVVQVTTPAPDTIAPSVPGNLSANSPSSTQVNLAWLVSSDNVGVTGYRLERCQGVGCAGFIEFATTAAINYVDNGRTAGTAYRYRVRATDAAGNLSAYSSIVDITTPLPIPVSTGFLSPTANQAVTSASGDNNGFQTSAQNVHSNDSSFGVDTNSGTNTSSSCASTGKDRHIFQDFGVNIPSGLVIRGIQVRLDSRVDSQGGIFTPNLPKMCVELSWNGGTNWVVAKSTPTLTTSEATYLLGSATDNWGRSWTVNELTNANFRVRITNVASGTGATSRDFSLEWAAVQVTYQ